MRKLPLRGPDADDRPTLGLGTPLTASNAPGSVEVRSHGTPFFESTSEEGQRHTIPAGYAQFSEPRYGWPQGRAHGLTTTRVPILLFDEYIEQQGISAKTLICLEVVRDPCDDKAYVWITTSDDPIRAPFRRFIRRQGGTCLVKYCKHTNGNSTFGFLTFDDDPNCYTEELASLQEGLLRLTNGLDRDTGEHAFFGGAPKLTIAVREFRCIEIDLVVIGFDGQRFFGARYDASCPIELATQTIDAFEEDFELSCESASWTPFLRVDFEARLEGFSRPYESCGSIFFRMTVYDPRLQTLRFCQCSLETASGFAEDHWSLRSGVLIDERLEDGTVLAWLRVGDQEFVVMPLQNFFVI